MIVAATADDMEKAETLWTELVSTNCPAVKTIAQALCDTRAATVEACAKVAEEWGKDETCWEFGGASQCIAHDIRALAGTDQAKTEKETPANASTIALCSDCPPIGYPTDKTRCAECPRRTDCHGTGTAPLPGEGGE